MKLIVMAMALVIFSCVFVSGCGNPIEDSKTGEEVSKEILQKLGVAWKTEAIGERLGPELIKAKKDLDSILEVFATCLGPIKSIDSSRVLGSSVGVGNKHEFTGKYQYNVTFEKAKGEATVAVYKYKDKWYLENLNIVSDALKSYKSGETNEAMQAGEEFVKSIFTDWNAQYVKDNASEEFRKTFGKDGVGKVAGEMSINAILGAEQLKLGKFVKIKSKKSGNYGKANGNDVFQSFYEVECEKGKAMFTLNMEINDNKWKIRGFNFSNK